VAQPVTQQAGEFGRATLREIDAGGADSLLHSATPPTLVDVREQHEWDAGHLAGALHAPVDSVTTMIHGLVPNPETPLVVYCAHGVRSARAAVALGALGYTNVQSLAGGIVAWEEAGLPLAPTARTDAQRARYARHLALPGFGAEGQARLLRARVLILGAGGLGSPAALYLAAAGVGTLRLVDFDTVDISNLQRQVIHTTPGIGTAKVASAANQLRALNPDIQVEAINERLTADNAAALMNGMKVILDCTDTFDARYALNRAALAARIPVVHASVYRYEARLTVFTPGSGPCYRCMHATEPSAEAAPACDVAGVLGSVPGVFGALQATEAIKLLLGIGAPLVGRIMLWDALDARFDEMRLQRDPACADCSTVQ
jgi:molybdopterin/thiamine biosynthesis adenylyltransferase/rhodanese-related sulfurtransferase